MKDRNKVCGEIYRRYQKAGKKERGIILDEYTVTLRLNRDYLARKLAQWGRTVNTVGNDGKPVKIIAKPPQKHGKTASTGRKRGRKPKYQDEKFITLLTRIWALFEGMRGKLLAPMMRLMPGFLDAEFAIEPELRGLLYKVSPATIDRILKPVKDKRRLRGLSLTKPGSILREQIPIRVMFNWDERKPGFFELDRVAHCGSDASGQFCQTLTVTDVGSGWTEEHALLNSAHSWVKERIEQVKRELPFPMIGIDSDNGGEFINTQLKEWCDKEQIQFTRGRPYKKNDNCFVEQKNGDVVRKTVFYDRYEGQEMAAALEEVYRHLNPLLNYWYPTFRLIAKEKQSNGRYKKIYEKVPKTPCQRLLDSKDISEECKSELRRRQGLYNPVTLKKAMNKARDRLLTFSRKEGIT